MSKTTSPGIPGHQKTFVSPPGADIDGLHCQEEHSSVILTPSSSDQLHLTEEDAYFLGCWLITAAISIGNRRGAGAGR